MGKKWLVALGDADRLFASTTKTWLEDEGHRAAMYISPEAFLQGVRKTKPALAFLDVSFGRQDGRDICRGLRQDPATEHMAVILVSNLRRDVADMVKGLAGGADDYLLKPLDRRLTLARLDAVMRRLGASGEPAESLHHHELSLDVREHKVRAGSRDIALTRMEFDLLAYILRRPGRVLTALKMLAAVWDHEPQTYADPATVQVHLSRLRRKLGGDFSKRLTTLINVGYRLD